MGKASQLKQAEGREPRPVWTPPEVRRKIEITDYDFGERKVIMELRRSDRLDCYDYYIDGDLWKPRIGWSRVQEWVRKAFPRVLSI